MDDKVLLEKSIKKYCAWLNMVTEAVDSEEAHRYKPEDFTSDHENGHYGYANVVLTTSRMSFYPFAVILCDDGDEGGGTTLYVWFDEDTNEPWHMCQEFDTMVGQIMYEGRLMNTKGFDREELGGTK